MNNSGFNFQQNHFQLFGLEVAYAIDLAALDTKYRALQAEVHPDKAAHLSEAEQRLAMQRSTRVNEAFQTLRSPLLRARYLLSLHGVDTQEETNTAMPMDFLMAQMEWREDIESARRNRDAPALDRLSSRLRDERRTYERELGTLIDDRRDYVEAAGHVRKLKFMDKLAEELDSAFDAIDD